MSKGRTSDCISMGEFSALLDDDSDGQRLAEFLLKKNGGSTRPRRVFPEHKSERFSIDIRTEKIKTTLPPPPVEQSKSESHRTTNNKKKESINDGGKQPQCDVAKVQEAHQTVAKEVQQKGLEAEVSIQEKTLTNSGVDFTKISPVIQQPLPPLHPIAPVQAISTSPSQRLSLRRSGGTMPSADRLRRFSLKRLSTVSVGRKLLQEFESTVSDSDFLPPVCSTPMTHTPSMLPIEQNSPNDNNLENIPSKALVNEAAALLNPPSLAMRSQNNTEKMLNSLYRRDAALQQMLEQDNKDELTKQTFEKENLHRNNTAITNADIPKKSIEPISNSRLSKPPTTPVSYSRSHPPTATTSPSAEPPNGPSTTVPNPCGCQTKQTTNAHSHSTTPSSNTHPTTPNSDAHPTTPISHPRSRPTTPISKPGNCPTTPISNSRRHPTTPVSNSCSRPTTPVSNSCSRPTAPISKPESLPTTPISESRRQTTSVPKLPSRPTTQPVSKQPKRPSTPGDHLKRRTYIIQKGTEPGQVILTPTKSRLASEEPQQQQQPTSTVEDDGVLQLPSSPVEAAVCNMHLVRPMEPDSPTQAPLLPLEPVVARTKAVQVMQRNAVQSNTQTASKVTSVKKSRIPLMTSSAVKMRPKKAPIDIVVPNTPELRVKNTTRNRDAHIDVAEDGVEMMDIEIPETQELPVETQQLITSMKKAQSTQPMIVIPIHQTFTHTSPQFQHTTIVAGKNVTSRTPVSQCHNYNETTTTPVNIEPDTTVCQPTSNAAKNIKEKSQMAVTGVLVDSPMPETVPNEDDLRLCDIFSNEEIITPPKSRSRRRIISSNNTNNSQLEGSNAPLNLASQKLQQQSDSRSSSATRSKRLRKRSATRRTLQKQQPISLSPLQSTETENEVGPPRAHPLIKRRTSVGRPSRRNIPLNAEPSTPINGERFAAELKNHLARLNNHEILDLRKRNSLGKVFAISGRRKSSLSRKSSLVAKQALEKQLQLEEEIEMEILKRQLNGEGDGLVEHSPVSEPKTVAEVPPLQFETEEIYELSTEEAELLSVIPPAPTDFRDKTVRESLMTSFLRQARNSSLIDEKSSDQVKFVSNDVTNDVTQSAKTPRGRGRRKQKPVPEIMQKYLEVHNSRINRSSRLKSFANQTKRSLYTEETEKSFSQNSSMEQVKSPPKRTSIEPTKRRTRQSTQRNQTIENILLSPTPRSHSPIEPLPPLPPPDSFADELLVERNVAESMAQLSSVAGTSIANVTEEINDVFKKPQNPAPKKRKTKKRANDSTASAKSNTNDTQKEKEKTTPPKKNTKKDDVLQINTAEPHDETSTVRRSKRGPKPLTNYWSFRSTDPTPLYDIAILEKRRLENTKMRVMRLTNSKAASSMLSENSTMPTASSTIKNSTNNMDINMNNKKKRGRKKKVKNVLGDKDSSSLSASSSQASVQKQKRLTMIEESESQLVAEQVVPSMSSEALPSEPLPSEPLPCETLPSEQLPSEQLTSEQLPCEQLPLQQLPLQQLPPDQNLGDNMFNRLDEVDISTVRSHKISHTPPQRNDSPVPKKAKDAETVQSKGKKSAKISQKASKKEKKPPQPKKLTKATAAARKNKNQQVNGVEKPQKDEQIEKEIKGNEKKDKEKVKNNEKEIAGDEENLEEHNVTTATESGQLLALSSTAAHINDIFDKLKNNSIMTTTTTTTTTTTNATKDTKTTTDSTAKRIHSKNSKDITNNTDTSEQKSCRVRLSRIKSVNSSSQLTSRPLSRNSSSATLQSVNDDDISSNTPTWLRDISHVGSKILSDSDKERELFEQMLCSQPKNLVLTDVDGLDYAYYENNQDIPFGYMRFQPNQAKRTKKARYYNLRFFVLSGIFKICTNKDVAHFSEGSVITILKGSRYSITNLTDKLAIMMVFKK